MTTASSCCAVSRQTSHPECSARFGANRFRSCLPPERLPSAAAFAGFRTNADCLAIQESQKRLPYRPLTTPQIADCFFRSGRLAFQRTSGIPKLLPGRFYACCKRRTDTPLFFSPLTRTCPLSVNVSTGSKAASPSSSCAGTARRYCGNSRAPPEPSSWQPALRGRAWTSLATVCRCSSFHACRLHSRTPSTSMKRETIPPCVTSSGASSCRKCRSSSSRASDAPSARKRTPAWLPSWMSDAAPEAATDRMYWTRCRKCRS